MQRPEIPSLTGLRFYAAALVVWAHTVGAFFIPADVPILRSSSSTGALGMTLFFVLSGFVIHYNYGSSVSTLSARAIYSFAVARFARLYPLFFLCFVITVAMSREPVPALREAWPFYVTMTHDWFPREIGGIRLGDLFAPASRSISAEVFLYLIYIALARPLDRLLRSDRMILWVMGTLAALVSLFYLGRVAGWWWMSTSDDWLFYRSPLCRISEFVLGALVAALYGAKYIPGDRSGAPDLRSNCRHWRELGRCAAHGQRGAGAQESGGDATRELGPRTERRGTDLLSRPLQEPAIMVHGEPGRDPARRGELQHLLTALGVHVGVCIVGPDR